MLLTRAHALTTAALLSTSLAIASPVSTAQSGSNPVTSGVNDLSGPETQSRNSGENRLDAASDSLDVLTKYYPGLSPQKNDPAYDIAVKDNPFQIEPSMDAGSVSKEGAVTNPFNMPEEDSSSSPTSAAKPFAINGVRGSLSEPSDGIDERALRYYADQRNLERVGAEIRRLKALNPSWTPPTDLFTPRSNVDEQPAWDLFAEGKFKEARQKLDDWKKADANYQPSADLQTKLDDGEARNEIKSATEQKDWSRALKLARDRPSLLVCGEMDVLWRIGEAFARTEDHAGAFDLYAYILRSCSSKEEQIATLQKAALLLPQKGIDALVDSFDVDVAGSDVSGFRFAELRAEIAKSMTSTIGRMRVARDGLSEFENHVREAKTPKDANLLGWFSYNTGEYEAAREWFDLALAAEDDDDEALKGYVLSLRNLEKLAEAEEIAFESMERSSDLGKIYIELVAERINALEDDEALTRSEISRVETAIDDMRSALGAQTLGWYLLDQGEAEEAGDWFAKSVEWEESEEAVVGLAVVASRTKDSGALKGIKADYGERYAALSEFEEYRPPARVVSRATTKPRHQTAKSTRSKKRVAKRSGGDSLMRQANRQFEAGQYQAALQTLDRREARNGKSYGAEVLRGWTNYKLKRWDEAERVFKAQDRVRSTKGTRFGIGAIRNSKYGMWPENQNKCTERWRC
ncbi:hypothetical protein FP2506_04536 [Fulvimarina pelagi HTCC2506]|uniref:Uncharacterized protein n=2 Tax=Fulvimarina pelagi TaxID=217511 RepID=Q0FZX5_9HYPH|nr:tetratricopeptide repeat protein [Fulvimarina pelagi]EAU40466.1 hypothetical protein FP2506_04536 [Fulvimarina pelagi HTCC2506]BAT31494.1 hypothetical protein [Fulvimarina pelagi]